MEKDEICTKWIKCEKCKKYETCFREELRMEKLQHKTNEKHLLKKAFWEKEGGSDKIL